MIAIVIALVPALFGAAKFGATTLEQSPEAQQSVTSMASIGAELTQQAQSQHGDWANLGHQGQGQFRTGLDHRLERPLSPASLLRSRLAKPTIACNVVMVNRRGLTHLCTSSQRLVAPRSLQRRAKPRHSSQIQGHTLGR